MRNGWKKGPGTGQKEKDIAGCTPATNHGVVSASRNRPARSIADFQCLGMAGRNIEKRHGVVKIENRDESRTGHDQAQQA